MTARIWRGSVLSAALLANIFTSVQAFAQAAEAGVNDASSLATGSPWMFVPTVSSDPKVGTSLGFMGSYLFKLNPDSTTSMAGVMGSYSNTNSFTSGLFLRSYWNNDSQRLTAAIAGGKIRNDYSDYLGSGLPASTTDNMKLFFARYYHEVAENWFVGGQLVNTNYMVVGDDFTTNETLKLLGLSGFDSGAVGLSVMYDSRDNQNAPTSGMKLNASNLAYRERLGGDENFDTYKLEFDHYLPQRNGSSFAYRAYGRWTSDAPHSGYSSVSLRGYTRGQYLAPNSVTFEMEQRWHLKGRWGLNLFAGVTCLYGDDKHCDDSENLYPSAGIGLQYTIKPEENMVLTTDFADGKGENSGFYLRFGQAF